MMNYHEETYNKERIYSMEGSSVAFIIWKVGVCSSD